MYVAITGAENTVMHVQLYSCQKGVFDANICYEKMKIKFK
jgi:hypothetical protein